MLQTRNVTLASTVFHHEEELSLHLSDNLLAHLPTAPIWTLLGSGCISPVAHPNTGRAIR
jgi:hypothetical protein